MQFQMSERDADWINYHVETLAELVQPAETDEKQLSFASLERKAFELFNASI